MSKCTFVKPERAELQGCSEPRSLRDKQSLQAWSTVVALSILALLGAK